MTHSARAGIISSRDASTKALRCHLLRGYARVSELRRLIRWIPALIRRNLRGMRSHTAIQTTLISVLGFLLVAGQLPGSRSRYAAADDSDCVAGEARAAYSSGTPGIRSYKVKHDKSESFVMETFATDRFEKVQVTQGGCAHYDKAATFTVPSLKEKNQPVAVWIARAKSNLNLLPESKEHVKDYLLKLLESQKPGLLKESKNRHRGCLLRLGIHRRRRLQHGPPRDRAERRPHSADCRSEHRSLSPSPCSPHSGRPEQVHRADLELPHGLEEQPGQVVYARFLGRYADRSGA